jgi:ferrous iron transport protein B
MRIALIGQPNSGKSTLFNQVAGYRAMTANFPGTTVTYTESRVRVLGQVIELVDLPGTYSLSAASPAEREARQYLQSNAVDLIINVVDASHLARGLDLTLEILELERPTVVALNMMDEATREGLSIDTKQLSRLLGVPVVPIIASKGRGVLELFSTALKVGVSAIDQRPQYSRDVEAVIANLAEQLDGFQSLIPRRTLAIRLIEGDRDMLADVEGDHPALALRVHEIQSMLAQQRGRPADLVIASERHALAMNVYEAVVTHGPRQSSWRDRLDDILLHPLLGYVALLVILLLFFQLVYGVGHLLEDPLLDIFGSLSEAVATALGTGSLVSEIAIGLIQGIAGGAAIVLPYLVPFLLGLGLLEDIGYLPRVAFLMDGLMHRLGLHGKAVVPFILGYGCNVPAIMSTRIMEDERDRFIAAALSTLVPCAARLAVVFGLVAFYLGPTAALAIYILNLFVIGLVGRIMTRLLPEATPGLILEMPVYRLPTLQAITAKAWWRIRDFIVSAWPLLIGGSVVLAVLQFYSLEAPFNLALRPLTWALGLPREVGTPLVFGILRKELSLIMLQQALAHMGGMAALTASQMMTFTVFIVFYVPCVATLGALQRELGTRRMVAVAGLTVAIATTIAVLVRLVLWSLG